MHIFGYILYLLLCINCNCMKYRVFIRNYNNHDYNNSTFPVSTLSAPVAWERRTKLHRFSGILYCLVTPLELQFQLHTRLGEGRGFFANQDGIIAVNRAAPQLAKGAVVCSLTLCEGARLSTRLRVGDLATVLCIFTAGQDNSR